MTDVKNLKDRGLPLKIDGATRFVKGATKYTTCADVIKMVLKKTGIGKEYRHLFIIYEITKDGEKALSGKTKILKVAKGWTGEKNKFVLRKTNPLETVNAATNSSKGATKSKESKKVDKKLFSKITRSLKTKSGTEKHKENSEKQISSVENNLCDTTSESDSSLEQFISGIDKPKMVEFIKFFNAMTTHEEKQRRKRKVMAASDGVTEEEARRGSQLKSCRRLSRRSTRARSKTRRRPISDVHPLKMHSVQRLDYGFIENLKSRETKQPATTCDIETCLDQSQSSFQRQTFTLKRYFRQSNAKSHKLETVGNEAVGKSLDASEVQDMLAQSFKMTTAGSTLQPKCHEIWHEDFRRERDSDPDSISSDDSLDRDSVLSYFDRVAAQDMTALPEDIFRANKLVDYSITDDELSDIETGDEEFDRNAMDVGYGTADTSLGGNCYSEQCETMETSFSRYGYHDNQAFTSDSESGEAVFSQTEMSIQNKHVDVAYTSDYIRSLFGKAHAQTEDDEMDSFMESKVFDDSIEEGLCWIQSEGETDGDL